MIVRLWKGRVPADKAEEYTRYQLEVGPPNYRVIDGNVGGWVIGRELDGGEYEIGMLTLWESWEAIRAFAGDPVDKARYYERDFDFLIDPPETVDHWEVVDSWAGP